MDKKNSTEKIINSLKNKNEANDLSKNIITAFRVSLNSKESFLKIIEKFNDPFSELNININKAIGIDSIDGEKFFKQIYNFTKLENTNKKQISYIFNALLSELSQSNKKDIKIKAIHFKGWLNENPIDATHFIIDSIPEKTYSSISKKNSNKIFNYIKKSLEFDWEETVSNILPRLNNMEINQQTKQKLINKILDCYKPKNQIETEIVKKEDNFFEKTIAEKYLEIKEIFENLNNEIKLDNKSHTQEYSSEIIKKLFNESINLQNLTKKINKNSILFDKKNTLSILIKSNNNDGDYNYICIEQSFISIKTKNTKTTLLKNGIIIKSKKNKPNKEIITAEKVNIKSKSHFLSKITKEQIFEIKALGKFNEIELSENKEKQEILEFIIKNTIEGVIKLTSNKKILIEIHVNKKENKKITVIQTKKLNETLKIKKKEKQIIYFMTKMVMK